MDRKTRKAYWKCFRAMSCDELDTFKEEICVESRRLEFELQERRRHYNKEKKRIDKLLETRPLPFYSREERDNEFKLHLNKLELEINEIKQKISDYETMRRDCLRQLGWNRGYEVIFEWT